MEQWWGTYQMIIMVEGKEYEYQMWVASSPGPKRCQDHYNLRNEVEKNKMQGANRFPELTDHYMKLYENEKPDTINCGPIMSTKHTEP